MSQDDRASLESLKLPRNVPVKLSEVLNSRVVLRLTSMTRARIFTLAELEASLAVTESLLRTVASPNARTTVWLIGVSELSIKSLSCRRCLPTFRVSVVVVPISN